MPLQITVGPPQLRVHAGQTVWSAAPDGSVANHSTGGLICRDTRLISTWALYANDQPWELLNSGDLTYFAARAFLTNRELAGRDAAIPARSLGLVLSRWIDGGVHDDIDITSHVQVPVRFTLELAMRSDFADIFEVRKAATSRLGRVQSEWSSAHQTLRTSYRNEDFHRAIALRARADSPAAYANGRLCFDVVLEPGATWHACLFYDLEAGSERHTAPHDCLNDAADSRPARALAQWHAESIAIEVANPDLARPFLQARDDIGALRIAVDGEQVPAAGMPWFLCLFGRDTLITSMQSLPLSASLARGTLAVLGARQATGFDAFRDAEPGKILHELRTGELAHFGRIPHTPYYGSADATPLYLMLLHQTWRWTGDRALLEAHLPTAEACLDWIDRHGDRDGDGFQEYGARGEGGYENQGWKDAGDAVLYPDGSPVTNPKALCEMQGYAYAAWSGMAEIFAALGRPDRAAELTRRAAALYNRFNDTFWNEEDGFYAFALDGAKQPVRSIASNVGHCLWTGIVRPDRARRVADRLMAPDMFSGWGVRTLSALHPAYNPISYHNGSVWPHDNGLIAQGLARYCFHDEAARIAHGISSAASYFAMNQVPELFAGIPRNGTDFPVQCIGANVPQAWAAGSTFSFLQALLGLQPDAPAGLLRLDPHLPDWLPDIILRRLRVGGQTFDLHFHRDGAHTDVKVLRGDPGAVRVARE
ncbi:MAG: amylo-alpha-1,6-glucosidase [Acetobacteraceae bacterium]|nr:amylo-alpha-1,6-glucosidase [Acetobacteraceae bacterium]